MRVRIRMGSGWYTVHSQVHQVSAGGVHNPRHDGQAWFAGSGDHLRRDAAERGSGGVIALGSCRREQAVV